MIDRSNNKTSCCGCGVCADVCPVQAIKIIRDEEGFEYPTVDGKKCIHCSKCNKACPMESPTDANGNLRKTYAVKHKDAKVRENSRSGGIFTALTDAVFASGGVVYGAAMDEHFNVKHIRAVKAQDRDKMRGSKYVQSSTSALWPMVKADISEGKTVLFSGTSCQIDGLRHYLGKNPENLYCIDIVCHGVPSPRIFDMYIKWREEMAGSKCKRLDFRNKTDFGWSDHIETLWMENGKRVDSKVYAKIFYSNYPLRPSCYECPYKSVDHPGDISIADYWNIDKACAGFNDNRGVSLVLINSAKGQALFDKVSEGVEFRETNIADSMQMPFYKSSKRPVDREYFWDFIRQSNFEYIATMYGSYDKKERINEKLYYIKSRIKKIYNKAMK